MNILPSLIRPPILSAFRHTEHSVVLRKIYTAQQLSVDKYLKDRQHIRMSLQDDSIKLKKAKLKNIIKMPAIPSSQIVNQLTEFMHLIDDTDDDFRLLEQALNKLKSAQTENLRKYAIGRIVMKTLYHFKKDQLAIKFYNDANFRDKFFGSKQTHLIFFDLLYKHSEYTELLKHFEELRKQLDSKQQIITRSIYVLIFAVCYQQNTEESFKYAQSLNEQYDKKITQAHCIFLSALALNQNAPHLTNQFLSTLWPSAHEAIISLRLLAFLKMHKFVDVLQFLRSILLIYDNNKTPKTDVISNEAIEMAGQVFDESCQDERLRNDFQQMRDNLQTHGYCVEKTINKMIFEPFREAKMTTLNYERLSIQSEFNQFF
ncbi:pentatricopeptide repeat-containing protein 2, mitochondrial-like [Contarinia nasturtii]|uniref:pentatricopeptide repeat-containing protein 2, mitochondrial-like n=1 Tax=Contarinia nasturtii TaxID=265458 RepID=UPI0012D473C3|nr:pentatricopeptide repeat-containing protein 2, mitochondrial-like [Contarinia nasturtii]